MSNLSELEAKANLNTKEEVENKEIDKNNTSATTSDIPSFGWSQYAERINGRFAMIGFLAILFIEIIGHSTFLNWAGLIN